MNDKTMRADLDRRGEILERVVRVTRGISKEPRGTPRIGCLRSDPGPAEGAANGRWRRRSHGSFRARSGAISLR